MGTTTPAFRFGAAQIDAEQRQLLSMGKLQLGARATCAVGAVVGRDRTVSRTSCSSSSARVVVERKTEVHISTLAKLLAAGDRDDS